MPRRSRRWCERNHTLSITLAFTHDRPPSSKQTSMSRSLPLEAYAAAIDLSTPFDRTTAGPQAPRLACDIAAWLLKEAGMPDGTVPLDGSACRALTAQLLTTRPAKPIPMDKLALLDRLFADESSKRAIVTDAELARPLEVATSVAGTRVQIWRGDITTLAIDAIVNAANADLLGCFRPGHACIDNAIHSAAGPRLREDCRRIIERQGHSEPTGTAKVTRGYYLPSRFVFHTVGPIVQNNKVTPADRSRLASCYESCLDLAATLTLKSIAFCGISTGVFGYPKDDAANVAKLTVRTWLEEHPNTLDLVVFNVFGDDDEHAYRQLESS